MVRLADLDRHLWLAAVVLPLLIGCSEPLHDRSQPARLARYAQAVAFALGRSLSAEERAELDRAVAEAVAAGSGGAVEWFEPWADRAGAQGEERRRLQERAFTMLMFRARNDALLEPWKTVIRLAMGSEEVLVPGTPPLTRAVVDAHLGLTELSLALLFGVPEVRLDADQRARLGEQLPSAYPTMPAAARQALAELPAQWLQLRTYWLGIGPELRARFAADYRDRWLRSAEQAQARWNARQQAQYRQWRTRYQAYWERTRGMSGEQKLQELQAQLATQNMAIQTMSNMLQMQHQTNMTIIHNMGDYDWHWSNP
ncbi:MAG: hypothetical protein KatS3mg102_2303 [Planctomycetota bacterium]|nr:MAG: hypothetical protein KatS3mg102_2303 [Planctomycetota bacterium]